MPTLIAQPRLNPTYAPMPCLNFKQNATKVAAKTKKGNYRPF